LVDARYYAGRTIVLADVNNSGLDTAGFSA